MDNLLIAPNSASSGRISGKDGESGMDLEIHVPISPTQGFLNRFRYLFKSWQINGDPALSYRFVVTVGADQEPDDLEHFQNESA